MYFTLNYIIIMRKNQDENEKNARFFVIVLEKNGSLMQNVFKI